MGFTFDLLGIPVFVSIWSILMVAMFWFLGILYIGKQFPIANKPSLRNMAFISAIIAVICVALHELSHAIVAASLGIPITGAGISGWGAWVEIEGSTYDLAPLDQLAISAAGPFMNLFLGSLFAIPVYRMPETLLENTFQYLAFINLGLGKLNLLPIFFLDGWGVVLGLSRIFSNDPIWNFIWAVVLSAISGFLILKYKPIKNLEKNLETL